MLARSHVCVHISAKKLEERMSHCCVLTTESGCVIMSCGVIMWWLAFHPSVRILDAIYKEVRFALKSQRFQVHCFIISFLPVAKRNIRIKMPH